MAQAGLWIGGASSVAQVATMTIANTWAASDTMTTTLTAEDGSTTQTVNTVVSSATLETCIDEHLADLQASQLSMFQAITWAKGSSTTITATAAVQGVPFYIDASETTAGSGTWVDASTTANAGPEDYNTGANWDDGSVPTSGDLRFVRGSYDCRYGLDQTANTYTSIKRGNRYKGTIGDPVGGFYLAVGATTDVIVESTTGHTWIKGGGTITNFTVTETPAGDKAVAIAGTVTNLDVGSPSVRGTVWCATNSAITNCYVADMTDGKVVMEDSTTDLTLLYAEGGVVDISRDPVTVHVSGAEFIWRKDNDGNTTLIFDDLYVHTGGTARILGGNMGSVSDIGNIHCLGGVATMNGNESATFRYTNVYIRGGKFIEQGSMAKMTAGAVLHRHGTYIPESGDSLSK